MKIAGNNSRYGDIFIKRFPTQCVPVQTDFNSLQLFICRTLEYSEAEIADFFTLANSKAEYTYDVGDNWRHIVLLEDILPRRRRVDYPWCVEGERACPPEDCGGAHGYEDFLNIIMDPGHEEHNSMLEWAGGEFHPEHFDCSEVFFDDPAERLEALDEDF